MSTALTTVESGRANSRAALVEAAFDEFTTKGYEAATVAGIADLAGVTTGAVYAHFSSKLDLLLATVGLTPIADIAGSLQGLGTGNPRTRAGSFGRGLADRPDRRRVLLLDVIVMARRDPEVAAILRDGLEAYLRLGRQAIDVAAKAGSVDPAISPEAISRLLAVVNLGMIVFAALDAPTPPASAFDRIVEALLPSTLGHRDGREGDGDDTDALAVVRGRADAAARAQHELHTSIAAAIAEGHSLRVVGAAAGLSHEAVRRIAKAAG